VATTTGEDKRKHLEMIQGVINRMASNSFLFKGWSVTIIAAISAFAAKDNSPALMVIPALSTLLFWATDAYYLMLERAFRALYNEVISKNPSQIDYKMNIADKGIGFGSWLKTLKRPVLVLFYGVVLLLIVILICILNDIGISFKLSHGS
jgi:hypothetical protein